ncbi:ATPase domain-containing protein [Natronomonas sp. EA1]|uniref:ATPase domain-containing protein n=1 Tax=Natronomonas sp. EA1 TaxID=3421655 RepID=UPI003EB97838
MSHYSLGLTSRDRVNHAFGGGLPSGAIVLLQGPDGSGKSVWTQRMAYGLAEEGTTVGVTSTDLTASDFLEQMHSISYGVTDHLLSDRIRFFHADVQAHPDLLDRLLTPSPLWRRDVVIVDGFGALCRNDAGFAAATSRGREDRAMGAAVSTLRTAAATGTVVVVTVNPGFVSEDALQPLRGAADVLLELRTKPVGNELRREALVRRFAGMKAPVDDTIGFAVQQGRGVVIESRTIA